MICRNYCFVCFGLFLVFQRIPGDSTTSTDSDTVSDDAFIVDIPFNPVCPAGCATCSTYNGCVTCQTTHFLLLQWHGMRQTGTCVRACPSGFYGTRKRRHGKCQKCPISNCDECSTNATCTTCATPFFLSEGHCLDRCPKSKPFATKARLCQKRVDCEMGQWTSWESCSSRKGGNCGTKSGRQLRTRLVLEEPSENGRQCPTAVQSRKCQLKPCDCKVETNESDPSQVDPVDENSQDVPDSPKKSRKPKKTQKKCKQRKNKKQPTKQTTKSEELRRKQTATPKPMKKTTNTKKAMTTTSSPS